ncbi:MAG: hypothetical protein P1V51_16830 [Deltaproteobacteria bacterium]|nr:hypothetical protein [Deltaproteobacteria bacterium]
MSDAAPRAWEPPLFETKVSNDAPFVGETVRYEIRVGHPPDVSVKLPTQLTLDPYVLNAVRREVEPATPDAGGLVVERFELDLGIYTLESGPIPPISLQVETAEGPAELAVAGPKLTVKTATAEEGAEAKALAPPVAVWMADHTLLWVGGVALGTVLLALVLWRLVAGYLARRRARPAPVAPPLPLDQRALAALEALQQEGLVAAGKQRLYFFALSEILRAYLGERFGFDALECTTEELRAALRDRPTPGLKSAEFEEWLALADMAKFARYPPTDAECSDALSQAVEVIHTTTAAARAAEANLVAHTGGASAGKGAAA